MSLDKSPNIAEVGLDQGLEQGSSEHKGTRDDQADMYRMGKSQQLRRNFRLVSIMGFTMILMASWETAMGIMGVGLEAGGRAGLIWMTLICWITFLITNISMAEIGSMAPTTGGQYHWVSEFAPPKYQKFLSYLIGWLCVLGWQSGAAAGSFVAGTQIQGLLVLNYPNYNYESYHGTLLMIGIGLFAVFFNTVMARKLPLIEGLILIIHIGAFIGIIVTLWVLAPRRDAAFVFSQFNNDGWSSLGLSSLAGATAAISPFLGADGAVHMAEELRDASKTVPRSMIWSTIFNGALCWVTVITMCFCMGNLDKALSSPTGYPFIEVFYNATRSTSATTAMTSFVIFMDIAAVLTMVATASRQLFAFARDSALPFSPWLSTVVWDIPVNATIVTTVTVTILSLINLGSAAALNNIISLQSCALLSSYICSIGCIVWRRLTGSPLLPSKFSLGKYGLPLNLLSVALLTALFVFNLFPAAPNPDAPNMNWAVMIYGVVVLFSLLYYAISGRHRYVGPVEYVRKLE